MTGNIPIGGHRVQVPLDPAEARTWREEVAPALVESANAGRLRIESTPSTASNRLLEAYQRTVNMRENQELMESVARSAAGTFQSQYLSTPTLEDREELDRIMASSLRPPPMRVSPGGPIRSGDILWRSRDDGEITNVNPHDGRFPVGVAVVDTEARRVGDMPVRVDTHMIQNPIWERRLWTIGSSTAALRDRVASGVVYRGTFDASMGYIELSDCREGDMFRVGRAGIMGDMALEVGDMVVATRDAEGVPSIEHIQRLASPEVVEDPSVRELVSQGGYWGDAAAPTVSIGVDHSHGDDVTVRRVAVFPRRNPEEPPRGFAIRAPEDQTWVAPRDGYTVRDLRRVCGTEASMMTSEHADGSAGYVFRAPARGGGTRVWRTSVPAHAMELHKNLHQRDWMNHIPDSLIRTVMAWSGRPERVWTNMNQERDFPDSAPRNLWNSRDKSPVNIFGQPVQLERMEA